MFALAPQEYITKIGQYLLTLPQNFEPFTMQDNSYLVVALRKSKLPYLDEKELSDDITTCWLDSITNATAIALCEEILNIQQLSTNAQRQLIIDIGVYFYFILFYLYFFFILNIIILINF
jgi:conserved oligomeric Golgi complex subunit 7